MKSLFTKLFRSRTNSAQSHPLYGAAVFAVSGLAALSAQEVADFLEQPEWAARLKQEPGAKGRLAMGRHIAGYAVVQGVLTSAALRAAGIRVPTRALLAGQAINLATHWVIDRGPALKKLAYKTKREAFFEHTSAGVNGRMLMDQACHKGILPIAAGVTALLARRFATA